MGVNFSHPSKQVSQSFLSLKEGAREGWQGGAEPHFQYPRKTEAGT